MDRQDLTEVAVVIVNYKMKEFVREALSSLFADVAHAPFTVKVVVVDNGSADAIGEMVAAEFPQAVFLQNGRNLGYGAAVNNGIRAVQANYYFVLNPDTRLREPRVVERLREFMEENPKAGMCAPRQHNFDGSLQETCYRFHTFWTPPFRRTRLGQLAAGKHELDRFLMRDWDHGKRRLVEWVLGSAMFVRARAIHEVGLMDERFFLYFEDTDWCRRFWEGGWPVYYVSDVVLEHAHRRTSAKSSVWRGVFMNSSTRYHVASWIQYLGKYGLSRF